MKQHLLIGAALLATLSVFSQSLRQHSQSIKTGVPTAELRTLPVMNEPANISPMIGSGEQPVKQQSQRPAGPPSTYNWQLLCGSMNAYGMLSSNQRPLQYHPGLDAISFIHRKSFYYTPSPSVPATAEPGVIVAEITTNWGASWDSTCLWSNDIEWGRYPQGGIYNPSGNTTIGNAYVVGSGPTVDVTTFSGNWYASKKLDVFNNVASTTPGAQQFYTFNLQPPATYPTNMARHAWSRHGFSVTDDGVLRSLGIIGNDLAGTSTMRGYAVITGTFNGTAIDWKLDSIIPPAIVKSDGISKQLSEGQMAWNQAGTVGYVVGIGGMANATGANRGLQPIVYKMDRTTNSNATWTLMPGLDFNTTFSVVPDHLPGRPVTYPTVTGDTTAFPFVENFDITVDANNNVHIAAIFMSGFSDHPDSLQYFTTYGSLINPSESYKWGHLPGYRPYIYDFIGDGVAPWKLVVVDSVASESPGVTTTQSGYLENPWDPSGPNGQKLSIDARLQLGRTPDGQYITFSWSESDSAYTFNQFKYNTLPDVKSRLMALTSGTNTYQMDDGPDQNVSINDLNVRTRATLHYMSPTTSAATVFPSATEFYTVDVRTPFTVTNSNPYGQLANNGTWFGNTNLSYKFRQPSTVGIGDNRGILSNSYLYPNPAKDHATLEMVLDYPSPVDVKVYNTVGQLLKTTNTKGNFGENKIQVDLSGLSNGIYLVEIKAGTASTTKKLIIE